jgi:hypothetical protein
MISGSVPFASPYELGGEMIDWLNEVEWQVFLTFWLPYIATPEHYEKEVNVFFDRWLKRAALLGDLKGMKIAGMSIVVNHNPGQAFPGIDLYHCHLLLTSDPGYPRNLSDVSEKRLKMAIETYWNWLWQIYDGKYEFRLPRWFEQPAKLRKIDKFEIDHVAKYLSSGKNCSFRNPDKWQIFPHRGSVLERLKQRV